MTVGGGPGGGLGAGIAVMHTDDAATKLSDRVRRRCFNCCTTETSTWRRSNLSPGKVLCNKCGLFERTHSRPRPEQFPHKRGPLASSTLRSPGAGGGGGQQQAQVGSSSLFYWASFAVVTCLSTCRLRRPCAVPPFIFLSACPSSVLPSYTSR
ncbi:hypothetical protein B0H16DRAFT_1300082 [Mycena metata]|uniref:GATA-type domain-containing protein n=1 Tax=Mycena metata TaxID=1033252 RepID=A0AAD7K9K4_9AGAR|nr:hypothetical protein B0H16DRAFT_1300082 [Mycena metata]